MKSDIKPPKLISRKIRDLGGQILKFTNNDNFTDHEQEGVTNDTTNAAKSDDDDISDNKSEASDGQTKAQTPNEEHAQTTEQTPVENIHIGKFRKKSHLIKYLNTIKYITSART